MFGRRKVSNETRVKLLALLIDDDEEPNEMPALANLAARTPASPAQEVQTAVPTPQSFPYTPLNSRRKEIRILTISPLETLTDSYPIGLWGSLNCTLQTVSLLDNPVYEALSYRWGDPNDLAEITLNGVPKAVTKNLSAALRQFRYDARNCEPVHLWADAICINQEDVIERNEQVALMRDVYSQASNVRIWLGECYEYDEDMAYAFKLLHLVGSEGKSFPERLEKWFVKPILGLGKMFSNPYWKRRWITQEVALAKTLSCHYGVMSRSLTVEEDLLNIQSLGGYVIQKNSSAQHPLDAIVTGSFQHTMETDPTLMEWTAMFEAARTLLSAIRPITCAKRMIRAGKASPSLQQLRGAECAREHDHVYGLLGIANSDWEIVPDYTSLWEDAFADFTAKVMKSMGTLNLLYYTPPGSPNLPSWTVDWRIEFGYNDTPVGGSYCYYASAGTPFSMSILEPRVVRLQGLIADTVKSVGMSTQRNPAWEVTTEEMAEALFVPAQHRVLKDWISLYYQSHGMPRRDVIDEAFLRTLLADYGHGKSTEFEGRIVTHAGRLHNTDVYRYQRIMNHFLATGQSTHRICYEAVLRMKKYAFFVTKDGRSGMSKPGLKEGDRICVFSSCDVPYCIRPHNRAGEPVYFIISPCYVEGIMDGEAVLSALAVGETCSDSVRVEDIFEDITLV